jgi:predicted RNA-binding protein
MKMCEAHAFVFKDGREEKLLENVDQVDVEGDEIRMINIFGEQKILRAKIKSYNNAEGKLLLEAIE